jgi:hypothetical protein
MYLDYIPGLLARKVVENVIPTEAVEQEFEGKRKRSNFPSCFSGKKSALSSDASMYICVPGIDQISYVPAFPGHGVD